MNDGPYTSGMLRRLDVPAGYPVTIKRITKLGLVHTLSGNEIAILVTTEDDGLRVNFTKKDFGRLPDMIGQYCPQDLLDCSSETEEVSFTVTPEESTKILTWLKKKSCERSVYGFFSIKYSG